MKRSCAATEKLMSGSVRLLVRFLRSVAAEQRKEKRLLPGGRLARPIEPRIGRLPWTSKGGDNLGSGKLGKRFGEGHGEILPLGKKYAMQKIKAGHMSAMRTLFVHVQHQPQPNQLL